MFKNISMIALFYGFLLSFSYGGDIGIFVLPTELPKSFSMEKDSSSPLHFNETPSPSLRRNSDPITPREFEQYWKAEEQRKSFTKFLIYITVEALTFTNNFLYSFMDYVRETNINKQST